MKFEDIITMKVNKRNHKAKLKECAYLLLNNRDANLFDQEEASDNKDSNIKYIMTCRYLKSDIDRTYPNIKVTVSKVNQFYNQSESIYSEIYNWNDETESLSGEKYKSFLEWRDTDYSLMNKNEYFLKIKEMIMKDIDNNLLIKD